MIKYKEIHLNEKSIKDFWSRVIKTSECWQWVGSIDKQGYGTFFANNQNYKPHRVAYTLLVGEVPTDMTIDHLCRNRACVNPAHMEVVTLRENVWRGTFHLNLKRATQTHCLRGHELTGYNLVLRYGKRICRACAVQKTREWRAARKARLP